MRFVASFVAAAAAGTVAIASCGGVDERTIPLSPQPRSIEELEDALASRYWVLDVDAPEDDALRPSMVFETAPDGDWTLVGFDGCNRWDTAVELVAGPNGSRVELVGEMMATAQECARELEPTPRPGGKYRAVFSEHGELALVGAGPAMRFVDLDSGRVRPIVADDLADSWGVTGTERDEVIGGADPQFRYGSCAVPVTVTPVGRLDLEHDVDWRTCDTTFDPVVDVLIGTERRPRSVDVLVAGDVMYLLDEHVPGPIHRLERTSS